MFSIHFSPSPIHSIPSFKKTYEISPVPNTNSSSFSLKHSNLNGSNTSISTTSSILSNYFRSNSKTNPSRQRHVSQGQIITSSSSPLPSLIIPFSTTISGESSILNQKLSDPSSHFKPIDHIYNKFKLEDSPLGIDCLLQSADSTVSIQNSIISINFDNESLEFDLKFPNFDNDDDKVESSTEVTIGDAVTKEVKPDSLKEENNCGSVEITPVHIKRLSIFSKVKGLWTTKHHKDKEDLFLAPSILSNEVVSPRSSFEMLFSPISMRVPIKESFRRRTSSFSLFQHVEDPNSPGFKNKNNNNNNNNNSIKFQDYADMLVYSNRAPPTPISDQIQEPSTTTTTTEVVETEEDNNSISSINSIPKALPKRRLSIKRRHSISVKRSLSFSLSKRRNLSDSNNTTTTTTTNNNDNNVIEAEPEIKLRTKPSILKNKINKNFETEYMNSIRDSSMNIEEFLQKFEKFEMEKYLKESQLPDLRLQQLTNYYNAKDENQ
ncbi:hypothetical protein DFJ63DRAFT_337253 [Scheffersomyces coipomensis]|uniref:uncharacterized protein n=1 Tax=Scheffersomyces coipomensis TaxID=1788519 RepID=UPI00315CAFF6